ncbi:hypothetical protein FHT78_001569 [Rhizobium sp. BK196]|nr:hypothetical protein [Rhizobium sp. BK196]MBB3462798.1 hypothetical protein [Rhizobium sp. BK377]
MCLRVKDLGFAPKWVEGSAEPALELKAVRGIDFRIGLGRCLEKERPDRPA